MNTKIALDRRAYDEFTEEFARILAIVVSRELVEAGLPRTLVRDLTEKIVFNLATMFDGNWVLSHDDKTLEPQVLFKYDGDAERLIWAEGGSCMHETVFGCVGKVFDEKDET
jgi:hypothetical protein